MSGSGKFYGISGWTGYHEEARRRYEWLSRDPAFMFGLALYIGEGSKTYSNSLCLTNCDPRVIRHSLSFFLQVGISPASLRCAIHLHAGLDKEGARRFWRNVIDLPEAQFYAVSESVSRASSGRKGNVQQHGTCQVYAHNTEVTQMVYQWMKMALEAR